MKNLTVSFVTALIASISFAQTAPLVKTACEKVHIDQIPVEGICEEEMAYKTEDEQKWTYDAWLIGGDCVVSIDIEKSTSSVSDAKITCVD